MGENQNKMKHVSLLIGIIALISGIVVLVATTSFGSSAQRSEPIQGFFDDVKQSDWFFDDVQYVSDNHLMNGISADMFAPDETATRGMIVTVLWRMEGEPEAEQRMSFKDVNQNSYYYMGVEWATENSIVSGYGERLFGPEDNVTREQLATILYRHVSKKVPNTSVEKNLEKFKDVNQISEYAIDAMRWAYAEGIINGVSETEINPQGNATRGQIAAILRRVSENVLKTQEKEDEIPIVSSLPDEKNTTSTDASPIGGSVVAENEKIDSDKVGDKRPVIQVLSSKGEPGDTVGVKVDIQENPGILGMVLRIKYDENAMKLVEVENGEAVSNVLTMTASGTLNSGAKFVWDGLEIKPKDIKNGTLLKLKFEILNGAEYGKSYEIFIENEPGDIVDAELNEIFPIIKSGVVEIEKGE